MNKLEDITAAIHSMSANQARSVELQTAYYKDLASQATTGASELVEQAREHLETLAKTDSFSSAFAANVKFEDGVKANVNRFYQKSADTTKDLFGDIARLYGLAEAPTKVEPKKPLKHHAKKPPKSRNS